jgi:hypothetical protein
LPGECRSRWVQTENFIKNHCHLHNKILIRHCSSSFMAL